MIIWNPLLFSWTKLSCSVILDKRVFIRSRKQLYEFLLMLSRGLPERTAQSGTIWNEGLMHRMDRQKHAQLVQRRARGVKRIASILDAAETVFAEVGYDEANTNRIAAQSGISPGSLYQFFSNKEEIAQALAARYTEELQLVYGSVFSVEAASLPFSIWLDQIIDALLAFHYAHPAFHILLSIPAPSVRFASLADALPKELQTRFELGFLVRAPHLSQTQRRLSATMTVQFFKAVLRQLLQAEEAERRLLVRELKTALHRYLEPLLS
jgi:AcrR family transcriptional regulator